MSLQTDLLKEGHFFGQNNIEVEEIVLATFVNYPDTYYEFAEQINLTAFSREETRYIYKCIDICSKESNIDIITVSDKLKSLGYWERIQNAYSTDIVTYLNNIAKRAFNDQHLASHVKILMAYSARRELNLLADLIAEKSNDMVPPEEIINKINSTIIGIQEIQEPDEFDAEKTLQEMYNDMKDVDGANFIKSYIRKLDDFIYGWELSDLIILAGAPSMGKTALALEIARNHIIKKEPIAIFSLEMSKSQLMTRLVASEACINLGRIRAKQLDTTDWDEINRTVGKFQHDQYWIDDKSGDLWKICNKIRKLYMKNGCKFFIIDYLQLMSVSLGKYSNREQEISKISRALKELARELGVVIIALSQVSRKPNDRSNKRPQLSDLRESGAIEQDADMVIFVYRPSYYNLEDGIPTIEDAELIIAKGRSTGIGKVDIQFISQYTKYISQEEINTHAKLQAL
jgi:replicative DNA helicase